mgnify:CR=1 FL=1
MNQSRSVHDKSAGSKARTTHRFLDDVMQYGDSVPLALHLVPVPAFDFSSVCALSKPQVGVHPSESLERVHSPGERRPSSGKDFAEEVLVG